MSEGSKEASKAKHPYITTITKGAPLSNLQCKGTMKRRIAEIIVVYRKEESISVKVPDRPMSGFRDSKRSWVSQTQNIFPCKL